MKTFIVNFEGPIPPKKNSKVIVCRGKRPFLFPSSQHKKWERYAKQEVIFTLESGIANGKLKRDDFPFDGPVKIEMAVKPWSERKFDLSNVFESVADVLVSTRIIKDDNWKVVREVTIYIDDELEHEGARVVVQKL